MQKSLKKIFIVLLTWLEILRKGIFSEIKKTTNVAIFRRNLQKSFIERMRTLMETQEIKNSDLFSIIRGELTVLKNQYKLTASNRNINKITKYHYKDCLVRN